MAISTANIGTGTICDYITDKNFGYKKMNDTSKRLLDMWINDSCSFFGRVFSRELEIFLNEFTSDKKCEIVYRGFYLDNSDGYFDGANDDKILGYLDSNSRLLESGTRLFSVGKSFAEEYAEGQDILSVVIECEAEKYLHLPETSDEQEVILFQPKYKSVCFRRYWTIE